MSAADTPVQAHPLPAAATATARSSLVWFIIGLVGAALFVIRVASPSNLLDQDQERPASYVLDVVKNNNWICQRDLFGEITSKPPLYTWLCAVFSNLTGGVNLFSLY